MKAGDRKDCRRLGLLAVCVLAAAGCSKSAPPLGAAGDWCLSHADCGQGLICQDGKCGADDHAQCTANAVRCNGATVQKCNANQNGWDALVSAEGSNQGVCPTGCVNGACLPELCKPFELRCAMDGGSPSRPTGMLQMCNSNGSGFTDLLLCPTACTDPEPAAGAPHAAYCEAPIAECLQPFHRRCKAPASGTTESLGVQTCNETMTAWEDRPCDAEDWQPGTAYAVGKFVANDWRVYKCTVAGTSSTDPLKGPLTEAVDIIDGISDGTPVHWRYVGPQGDLCLSGECRWKICDAGEKRCVGPVLEQCASNGSVWNTVSVCDHGCDPVGLRCETSVCRPWASRCNAADPTVIEVCNERGTAWVENDCDADEVCVTSDAVNRLGGRCTPRVCSVDAGTDGAIVRRDQRCVGAVRQECDDTETGWRTLTDGDTDAADAICPFGCTQAGVVATCKAPACQAADTRCTRPNPANTSYPTGVERCLPDRTGWYFERYCPAGCNDSTDGQGFSVGTCASTYCTPLARRCKPGFPNTVEVCDGAGTGWVARETCAQTCMDPGGYCVGHNQNCTAGEVRCQGAEVQVCTRLDNNATEWRFSQLCLSQCANGACTGPAGACGCPAWTGTTQPPICAPVPLPVPSAQPIRLKHFLPTTNCGNAPTANPKRFPCWMTADARSTLLVYSEPITDPSGRPVPDGTLVTFTHEFLVSDGTDDRPVPYTGLLASADLDPAMPGLQRPTLRGVARVLVRAPALTSTNPAWTIPTNPGYTAANEPRCPPGDHRCEAQIVVHASLGGNCGGTVSVPVRGTEPAGRMWVYQSEDFSTADRRDPLRTNAVWDTGRGMLSGVPMYEPGTGADGAFVAETPSNPGTYNGHNLYDLGIARSWIVTDMEASSVGIGRGSDSIADTTPLLANLSVGDEVLVVALRDYSGDAAYTMGTYEFKRVARVEFERVYFTEPLARLGFFGVPRPVGGSVDVRLQRVPQFTNVTVQKSARIVTKRALDGAGTGIIAFRATGTVSLLPRDSTDAPSVAGGTIDASGLGLSSAQAASNPARIDHLQPGGLSSGSGLGGGVIFFHAKTLSLGNDENVLTTRPTGSGTGGTLWVSAANLNVGFTVRTTKRFLGGSGGRVRLDYGAVSLPYMGLADPPPAPPAIVDLGEGLTTPAGKSLYVEREEGYYTATSVANLNLADWAAPNNTKTIKTARALGFVGGSCETLAGAPDMAYPPPNQAQKPFANHKLELAGAVCPEGATYCTPGVPDWMDIATSPTAPVPNGVSFVGGAHPLEGQMLFYRLKMTPVTACTQEFLGMTLRLELPR